VSLKIEDLSKIFDQSTKKVLDHLNIDISQSSFTALLGPSGCGKTTLLRIIAGLDRPSSGRVSMNGEIWSDTQSQSFVAPEKRNIGMVFQSYAVWPHMDVFENVAFPLRMQKKTESEIRKQVTKVLGLVGLEALATRRPHMLSGGQQQRVALARSLAQEPKLLLFDEPLSNLDASLRGQLRKEIRSIQQELKITAILVTHDWTDAADLCEDVIVLKDGKIEQRGSPSDIQANPASDFVRQMII
jgi:iron(III) transport system ATP-binding protein